jgi:hypothetical protein
MFLGLFSGLLVGPGGLLKIKVKMMSNEVAEFKTMVCANG